MPLGDVVDQFHDDDGLADAGTPKQSDLPALHERSQQVDHFDPRLEYVGLGLQVLESRRLAVDRPALDVGRDRIALIYRFSDDIEDTPERGVPDWHSDGLAGVYSLHSPHDTVTAAHGHSAHLVSPDMLLHLHHQFDRRGIACAGAFDQERVVDFRQLLGFEFHVENRTDYLHDLANVLLGCH